MSLNPSGFEYVDPMTRLSINLQPVTEDLVLPSRYPAHAKNVIDVTLGSGTFRPNLEHELVGTGAKQIDPSELEILAANAGGLAAKVIDTLLLPPELHGKQTSSRRLTRAREALSNSNTVTGLIGKAFSEGLFVITNPDPTQLPVIGPSGNEKYLPLVSSAVAGTNQAELARDLGTDYHKLTETRSHMFRDWEVCNIQSAVTRSILTGLLPTENQPTVKG
jgi:hypothetical protein